MPETKKNSRHGVCEKCNEEGWLLAKNPPRCAACYRAENPAKSTKNPKGQKDVRGGGPKRPTPPNPKPGPDEPKPEPKAEKPKTKRSSKTPKLDEIAAEVNAIEVCTRALDDLSPEALGRVLQYVTVRYAQTHGHPIKAIPEVMGLPLRSE